PGASCACSCAIRQLFSILPPRMVSRKWTCQLSSGHTLPSEAATPPSAMTVCALPRSDLQMRPTDTPIALASIAARRPAPPAPMTRTSWEWVSYFASAMVAQVLESEETDVGDRAGGDGPDVEIAERDAEEADPGKAHVVAVQLRDGAPQLVTEHTERRLRIAVHAAADEVAERVTRERV